MGTLRAATFLLGVFAPMVAAAAPPSQVPIWEQQNPPRSLPVAPLGGPGVVHFGNVHRNSLVGPGFEDVDFSILKTTKITERVSMQLRAESFDLLNHPNFGQPGSVAGAGGFGTIGNTRFPTGDSGSSRQLQFAVRWFTELKRFCGRGQHLAVLHGHLLAAVVLHRSVLHGSILLLSAELLAAGAATAVTRIARAARHVTMHWDAALRSALIARVGNFHVPAAIQLAVVG